MDTWISISKKNFNKVFNDFNYLKSVVIELSDSYEKQNEKIEDFARWNLPTEIASSWDNIDYFIKELSAYKIIDIETSNLLKEIQKNFNEVSFDGESFNPDIWTHEALKNNLFWQQQRDLANKILESISLINLIKK